MTLRIPAKVLLHVWSYDFYDMTLSTGKQRRHMIKGSNEKTTQSGFLTRSDTNWPVKSLKQARSLKLQI